MIIPVYPCVQVQTKKLGGLPDILVFNCHLENQRDFEFWRVQEEVRLLKDISERDISECDDYLTPWPHHTTVSGVGGVSKVVATF